MGHHTDVHAQACHDEMSSAGLPQPGPKERGPDEERSRPDKYCRFAEDGNLDFLSLLAADVDVFLLPSKSSL